MHPACSRCAAPIAAALLGLAAGFAAPGDGVPSGSTVGSDGLAARAKKIQNTCFALALPFPPLGLSASPAA